MRDGLLSRMHVGAAQGVRTPGAELGRLGHQQVQLMRGRRVWQKQKDQILDTSDSTYDLAQEEEEHGPLANTGPDMTFSLAEDLPLKGRPKKKGWVYFGTDSEAFTKRMMDQAVTWFKSNNYPDLELAAKIFLRTCRREGWISAINTWDGQKLTWGTGFARGLLNSKVWPSLDDSVKQELIWLVPRRFSDRGIQVDNKIRKDKPTLASLIYVAETPPHNTHVLGAMFRTFAVSTLGIDPDAVVPGRVYLTENASFVYFASRLNHYLPAGFRLPRDLQRALSLAQGPVNTGGPDPTVFVAACIRVFTENILRRFGEDLEGNRRVLKEDVGGGNGWQMIDKWERRMSQFVRQDASFTITPRVTQLAPAFRSATSPFLQVHHSLTDIPEGHLVLRQVNRFIDVGPK